MCILIFFFCLLSYSRFAPTRAADPWDGVRIADKFSPVCPQRLPNILNETAALEKMPKGRLEYLKRLLPFLQNQSEDCLYLNIFSPMHGKYIICLVDPRGHEQTHERDRRSLSINIFLFFLREKNNKLLKENVNTMKKIYTRKPANIYIIKQEYLSKDSF